VRRNEDMREKYISRVTGRVQQPLLASLRRRLRKDARSGSASLSAVLVLPGLQPGESP
jgi:hypothetical protein